MGCRRGRFKNGGRGGVRKSRGEKKILPGRRLIPTHSKSGRGLAIIGHAQPGQCSARQRGWPGDASSRMRLSFLCCLGALGFPDSALEVMISCRSSLATAKLAVRRGECGMGRRSSGGDQGPRIPLVDARRAAVEADAFVYLDGAKQMGRWRIEVLGLRLGGGLESRRRKAARING